MGTSLGSIAGTSNKLGSVCSPSHAEKLIGAHGVPSKTMGTCYVTCSVCSVLDNTGYCISVQQCVTDHTLATYLPACAVQWALHDYNCHLMDCYSDWSGMSEAKAAPKRAKKLNPSAFQVYTQERADMYEDREDNDDDDDDDDDDELIPKVN
jgi:hypothetical protein